MRISGVTIPDHKHLEYGLTAIYGVGRSRALSILKEKPMEITLMLPVFSCTKPRETLCNYREIREHI